MSFQGKSPGIREEMKPNNFQTSLLQTQLETVVPMNKLEYNNNRSDIQLTNQVQDIGDGDVE